MKLLFCILTAFPMMASAAGKPVNSDSLSKENLLIELTGKDYKKIKENDLYAEIVSVYRNGNEIALKPRAQTFLKRFPQSHFADNVLYLSGQVALQNKNYPEALKDFQKILKFYPHSNKAVAAQFAKAQTYKKLNLSAESKRVFKEVIYRYPGSPESFRAEAELKLLN